MYVCLAACMKTVTSNEHFKTKHSSVKHLKVASTLHNGKASYLGLLWLRLEAHHP